MSGQHWSEAESSELTIQAEGGYPAQEVADHLSKLFGRPFTVNAVRFKAKALGYSLPLVTPSDRSVEPLSGMSEVSPTPFKPAVSKLKNFVNHEADLEEMFRVADLNSTGVYRLVVQSDTHVPFHDPLALTAFKKFCDWYKPHGLINIGDFWEAEAVSHWPAKGYGPRRVVEEAKPCRTELDEIDAAVGSQCKWKRFFIGNHEDWLDQYMIARAPELMGGLEEFDMEITVKKLLGLKERGYRMVPINEILQVGHAHFIHGYFTNQHHAKKHLDVFGCNIYYGHTHDVQSTTNVTVDGLLQASSLGCLRDLGAEFLKGKPNKWVHSFGIFEFQRNGTYTFTSPIMIDRRFSYAGILFDGNI